MKYAKPELTQIVNAAKVVRGGKGIPVRTDAAPPHLFNATANAYEADE
jgi:hypothetical protein